MLGAFFIEEIKRREEQEERRRDEGRPRLEIPIERDTERPLAPSGEEKPDRGVVIIDYSVENDAGEEEPAEGPPEFPITRLPFDRPAVPV